MKYIAHTYGVHACDHVIGNPFCGLFLEMGLGKTVITGTALEILMYDRLEITKPLIVAPKRVAESTWTDEFDKWDHLQHLTVSKIIGTERQRKEALLKRADVYVIGVDNLVWLVSHYQNGWPFDCLVLDELSKFKNHKSARFKAARMIRPLVKRVIGLTGSPAPNGLVDLWAQLYLLDKGERLEDAISAYREKYFVKGREHAPYVYDYELKTEEWKPDVYAKRIYRKIEDICISMKAKDYLNLPARIDCDRLIEMSPDLFRKYKEFEKKKVLELYEELEDGAVLTAVNAAGLYTKLLQFANGAVYDEDKNVHVMHDLKLDELEEILDVAQGKSVLVFYSFQSDRDRILDKLKKYKPQLLKGDQQLKDWNARKIPLLLAHPASAGHGLNMQAGGNIVVWFGLPTGLELYEQGTARVDRQGQLERVINNRLIVKGTVDEKVARLLKDKDKTQSSLMEGVRALISEYTAAIKK